MSDTAALIDFDANRYLVAFSRGTRGIKSTRKMFHAMRQAGCGSDFRCPTEGFNAATLPAKSRWDSSTSDTPEKEMFHNSRRRQLSTCSAPPSPASSLAGCAD